MSQLDRVKNRRAKSLVRSAMFLMWMDAKAKARETWEIMKWLHALFATGVDPIDQEEFPIKLGRFFLLHFVLCTIVFMVKLYSDLTGAITAIDIFQGIMFALFLGAFMSFLTSGCTVLLDKFLVHFATTTKTRVVEYKRSVMLRADAHMIQSGSISLVGYEELPEAGALYVYDDATAGSLSICEGVDGNKIYKQAVDSGYTSYNTTGRVCPTEIQIGDIVTQYDPDDQNYNELRNAIKVDSLFLDRFIALRESLNPDYHGRINLIHIDDEEDEEDADCEEDENHDSDHEHEADEERPRISIGLCDEIEVSKISRDFVRSNTSHCREFYIGIDEDSKPTGEIWMMSGEHFSDMDVQLISELNTMKGPATPEQVECLTKDLTEYAVDIIKSGKPLAIKHGGKICGKRLIPGCHPDEPEGHMIEINPIKSLGRRRIQKFSWIHLPRIHHPSKGVYARYPKGQRPMEGDQVVLLPRFVNHESDDIRLMNHKLTVTAVLDPKDSDRYRIQCSDDKRSHTWLDERDLMKVIS